MHTSAHSAFLHCSRTTSLTSRTAVYGPVRTVVWQGSAGDCRPYADQTGCSDKCQLCGQSERHAVLFAQRCFAPAISCSALELGRLNYG
jgi:hypothetical protein